MPDLMTLQSDFAQAILGDGGDVRLAIYRDTVFHGLTQALRLSYPVTERLVGADFFAQTARAFSRQSPPRAPALARYGAGFPDFLAALPSLRELPYVADVARIDWAVDQASLAPEGRHAGRSFVLPTEQGPATITLAPSLRLVRTATAVHAIWLHARDGDEQALRALDWRSGPQWLVVHAEPGEVSVTPLTSACWHVCAALLAGKAIENAFAGTVDLADAGDLAALAGELLGSPFIRIDLPRAS